MGWIGFNLLVAALMAIDLGLFHRKSHEIEVREALWMSLFWIVIALVFNLGIFFIKGPDAGMQFLAGYVLEKSLSVDNLFVFLLIFNYFKVPRAFQFKILFWGIVGALVMRAIFIFAGVAMLHNFHWVMYIFGAVLVFTGFKLFSEKEKEIQPAKNPVVKVFQKFYPTTTQYHHDKFFVREAGRWLATPLFVVLLVVETTDVIFAVDSIPAVLAVSRDPFIVYTSNVFAILGLRALYFALAGMMQLFHYLHYGLGVILIFIGMKMLVTDLWHIPTGAALGFIALVLGASVIVSILKPLDKKA